MFKRVHTASPILLVALLCSVLVGPLFVFTAEAAAMNNPPENTKGEVRLKQSFDGASTDDDSEGELYSDEDPATGEGDLVAADNFDWVDEPLRKASVSPDTDTEQAQMEARRVLLAAYEEALQAMPSCESDEDDRRDGEAQVDDVIAVLDGLLEEINGDPNDRPKLRATV